MLWNLKIVKFLSSLLQNYLMRLFKKIRCILLIVWINVFIKMPMLRFSEPHLGSNHSCRNWESHLRLLNFTVCSQQTTGQPLFHKIFPNWTDFKAFLFLSCHHTRKKICKSSTVPIIMDGFRLLTPLGAFYVIMRH